MAKIMVVDDATFMRMTLKKILESGGHQVVAQAENGEMATENYIMFKPDIVTMDITMPVADGFVGIQGIREFDKDAKILVVSAVGRESNIVKAIELGAKGFLIKPFKPDRVLSEVAKLI